MGNIVTLSERQSEEIIQQIGNIVDARVSNSFWKVLSVVAFPLVGFAVAWGMLYAQVNHNSSQIDGQVLTVKDRDNLQNQIAAVAASVDVIRTDVREIKNAVK